MVFRGLTRSLYSPPAAAKPVDMELEPPRRADAPTALFSGASAMAPAHAADGTGELIAAFTPSRNNNHSPVPSAVSPSSSKQSSPRPGQRRSPRSEHHIKKTYHNPYVAHVATKIEIFEEKTRAKVRKQQRQQKLLLIDPRTSPVTKYWDIVTALALVFTAIFTPVEVGFVSTPKDRWSDTLFLANRAIDCIFLIDMAMQFCIMYPTTDINSPEGEVWVRDRRRIASHYLTSFWFAIDALSIGTSFFDILSPSDGPLTKFKGFRAIRVLRLIKLVRLVSVSRIFHRWENRISINYAKLSIAQILVGLVFACHLFACTWGLQASFDPLGTWPAFTGYCLPWPDGSSLITETGDDATGEPATASSSSSAALGAAALGYACPPGRVCDEDAGTACYPPGTMYMASFYWALTTITSVGYGDIYATPQNPLEQLICFGIMFCGAMLFAQIVGSFCGLAAALSPDKAQFRMDISDLNKHMAMEHIDPDFAYRLREYMFETMHLRQAKARSNLLALLSPGLAGEFALKMSDKWLRTVWWLADLDLPAADRSLHVDIARALRGRVFPPKEVAPVGSLYIVTKGRALFGGRLLGPGEAWGADEVLTRANLRLRAPAIAITYVCTYAVEGSTLRSLIAKSPEANRAVRQRVFKLEARRAFVWAAEEECKAMGLPFRGRNRYLYARNSPVGSPARSSNLSPLGSPLLGGGSRAGSPPPPGSPGSVPGSVPGSPPRSPASEGGPEGSFKELAPSAETLEGARRAIDDLVRTEDRHEYELQRLSKRVDSSLDAIARDLQTLKEHAMRSKNRA